MQGSHMDRLTPEIIEAALASRFGWPLRYFESIGSTNTEAMQWALEGAAHGAVVGADHQTAGRGRWGRSWSSEPGRLLQFSVVIRPGIPVSDAGLVTTAAGVAVAEGIDLVARVRARLKWPNDVTVGGRKVAGILVESAIEHGSIAVAIVGVGINVNWDVTDMPPEIAGRATSLAAETGGSVARLPVLVAVLERLEIATGSISAAEGRASVIEAASERSEVLGREVMIGFVDGSTLEGRAIRLLPTGALEIDAGGDIRAVPVGEIARLRTSADA